MKEEPQFMVCGEVADPNELRRIIEESRQNGTEIKVVIDDETQEMLNEIERHETQQKRRWGALAMMAEMATMLGAYNGPHRHNPPYFNYSGIDTPEQIAKREERKARKRGKRK